MHRSEDPIDRRSLLAGVLALGAVPSLAMGQVQPQGAATPERRGGGVRRPSPMPAALMACWCEGFGAPDRVRLTVTRGQAIKVAVEGKSGEGFVLVRGFLAAGAAMECVGAVSSASAASHTVRWSEAAKLPEVASMSVGDPMPGKLPAVEALQLAAAIMSRPDPHQPFDTTRKLEESEEAAVTGVMAVDPVRATYVKPADRKAFGEAMRVLASEPSLAALIGPASLWQGDPMAVVWPLERNAPPRQIVMTGQRVQASILQAARVGAMLDPLVLPPDQVEPVAAANAEVAKAIATVARLGGCASADPVIIGRVGVVAERRPRPTPAFLEILRMEGSDTGGSS
jgi:hypothetical protein